MGPAKESRALNRENARPRMVSGTFSVTTTVPIGRSIPLPQPAANMPTTTMVVTVRQETPKNPMAVAPIATSHSRLRRNRSPTAAITILPAIMPTA